MRIIKRILKILEIKLNKNLIKINQIIQIIEMGQNKYQIFLNLGI